MDGLDTGRLTTPASTNTKQRAQLNKNSKESQQQRILERLRQAPLSTIEARQELDIMSPAARVMELKEQGHNIFTYRQKIDGHIKVAVYVLLSDGHEV